MTFSIHDGLTTNMRLQRKFLWDLLLPDVGGYPGASLGRYCQSIRMGQYSIQDIRRIRSNAFRKGYPGFLDISDLTAEFLCPTSGEILGYFNSWQDLIVDKAGFFYPKSTYSKSIYVKLYDRDSTLSATYSFKGCFPTKFPEIDLSYAEDALVRFSVTFNVDKVQIS